MNSENSFLNILVAEDNDVSRALIVNTLKTKGYTIFEARDGGESIDVINDTNIDLAYVDINMSPKGGFDFIKHLIVKGIDIPVVIITADTSGDLLLRSNDLGVKRLLQKPVDPKLLLQITAQILKRKGHVEPLVVENHDSNLDHRGLMEKAIDLARQNAKKKRGRAFGAVVADQNGRILGQGANARTSQADPTAHAEVMAIRQASEKLGRTDLSDCILYCSSMPTAMGQALIESVHIGKVYYAMSHEDVGAGQNRDKHKVTYSQIGRNAAVEMFDSTRV